MNKKKIKNLEQTYITYEKIFTLQDEIYLSMSISLN